jgi:hypothetical protein
VLRERRQHRDILLDIDGGESNTVDHQIPVGLRASQRLSKGRVVSTIRYQASYPRRHGSPAAGKRPYLVAKRQRTADDRAAQEAAAADDEYVQHCLSLSRNEGMPLRSMQWVSAHYTPA